jgi:hypothetical protein
VLPPRAVPPRLVPLGSPPLWRTVCGPSPPTGEPPARVGPGTSLWRRCPRVGRAHRCDVGLVSMYSCVNADVTCVCVSVCASRAVCACTLACARSCVCGVGFARTYLCVGMRACLCLLHAPVRGGWGWGMAAARASVFRCPHPKSPEMDVVPHAHWMARWSLTVYPPSPAFRSFAVPACFARCPDARVQRGGRQWGRHACRDQRALPA